MTNSDKEYIISEMYRLFGYNEKDFFGELKRPKDEVIFGKEYKHTCNTVISLCYLGVQTSPIIRSKYNEVYETLSKLRMKSFQIVKLLNPDIKVLPT